MNKHLNNNDKLPKDFKKYFWDCNFDDITTYKYLRVITERLLNYGDANSIKWLFSRVEPEKIKDIITSSRNLNRKTRNYWNIIFNG